MTIKPTGRAGVYIHVPFCLRHCPYCDFTVAVVSRIPADAYADRLIDEWNQRGHQLAGRHLRSLYFGGGTPSLLPAEHLARVVAAIVGDSTFDEITLEANPERVARRDAFAWRNAGFSRISLGVQSLQADILKVTGRSHSPADALSAVAALRAERFAHISADLIFGVPGQDLQQVLADIDALVGAGVDHVSLYELTFEPGTSFYRRRRTGELVELDSDELLRWSVLIEERLQSHGFDHYEVSNFARPGGQAVHNSGYWAGDEYLGLGVGAHGLQIDEQRGLILRRANDRSLQRYLGGIDRAEHENLTRWQHAAELLMTGMRQRAGVDLRALQRRLSVDLPAELDRAIDGWVSRGWAQRAGDCIVPTREGLWQADTMAEEAMSALELVGAERSG